MARIKRQYRQLKGALRGGLQLDGTPAGRQDEEGQVSVYGLFLLMIVMTLLSIGLGHVFAATGGGTSAIKIDIMTIDPPSQNLAIVNPSIPSWAQGTVKCTTPITASPFTPSDKAQ